jgi:hypothetical protein
MPEDDVELLDKIAKEKSVSRGEIIRGILDSKGLSAESLRRISLALRTRFDGTFSAQQAERAAEVAVCAIASEAKPAG